MERKTWLFVVWRRLSSIVYRCIVVSLCFVFSPVLRESIRQNFRLSEGGGARGWNSGPFENCGYCFELTCLRYDTSGLSNDMPPPRLLYAIDAKGYTLSTCTYRSFSQSGYSKYCTVIWKKGQKRLWLILRFKKNALVYHGSLMW